MLCRINEELLGQMKQMQYQMMKMNGGGQVDAPYGSVSLRLP